MKVVPGESRKLAEPFDRQALLGVALDVRQHAGEALLIALVGRRQLFAFTHACVRYGAGGHGA